MVTIEERARDFAGNWRKFDSFSWYAQYELPDPKNWGIYYTHHRDSDLVDVCNAQIIEERFTPFFYSDSANIMREDHNHWAVGWIKGYAIRVREGEDFTPEFLDLVDILESIEDYPLLDEGLYSQMEYDSINENIRDACKYYPGDSLTDEQIEQVISYCWDTEEMDGHDYYPSDDVIRNALNSR